MPHITCEIFYAVHTHINKASVINIALILYYKLKKLYVYIYLYIYIYICAPVIHSKTYRGYVKLRVIPNAINDVIFV
jgi:hypothetical protein